MTERLTFSLMSRKYVLGINFIFVYICVSMYIIPTYVFTCVHTHTFIHRQILVTIVCNMGDDTLATLNFCAHKDF